MINPRNIPTYDPLAQLGERLGDNQDVVGSSPAQTIFLLQKGRRQVLLNL